MIKGLLTRLCLVGLPLLPGSAGAIDLPEGGDAILYQLEGSSETVLAKLAAIGRGGYTFEVTSVLRGEVPARFTIPPDAYLSGARLAPGRNYLVFLRKGPDGRVGLAMSFYSVQEVEASQAAAHQRAVAAYLANLGQPEALKSELLRQVDAPEPYLQYSAVAALKQRHLLAVADAVELQKKLESRTVTDPRARRLIIGQLGRLQIKSSIPLLERIARDPAEPPMLRTSAIEALTEMKATASLKAIGADVEKQRAIGPKRTLIQEAPKRIK